MDYDKDKDGEGEFVLSQIKEVYAPEMKPSDWTRLFKEFLYKMGEESFLVLRLARQQPPEGEDRIHEMSMSGPAHRALTELVEAHRKANNVR